MPRERLLFKNNHELIFEAELEQFQGNQVDAAFLKETIRRWQKRKVQDIFLFFDEEPDEALTDLIAGATEAGLELRRITLEGLRQNDKNFLLQLNHYLADRLKNGSILFLYAPRSAPLVLSCAAILMMSLKSKNGLSTPEGAIRYLTGRDSFQETDLPVFQFKRSLDETYSLPPAVSKMLGEEAAGGEKKEIPPGAEQRSLEEKTPSSASPEVQAGSTALPVKSPEAEISDGGKRRAAEQPAAAPTPASIPAAAKPEAQSAPAAGERARFISSRFFTISNKLILIISGIIVGSLGAMIFLASYFYRGDSQARIEESGLSTTNLIAQNIDADLQSLRFIALNAASSLLSGKRSREEVNLFLKLFYQNNDSFVHLAVVSMNNGSPVFSNRSYNRKFLSETQLTPEKLQETAGRMCDDFARALGGAPVVRNVSPGLPAPLLGLLLPFGDESRPLIVVALLNPARFLESFKDQGIIKPYMVDSQGIIVAHQDSKLILAGASRANSPVVKKMLQSPINNSKIRFQDRQGAWSLGFYKKMNFAGLGVVATVREDLAFEAVNDMQRRNIFIMVIILFIAVLIVFFFARTLSVPIRELVGATRRIEAGDYQVEIAPSTRDEIGSLTNSFGEMAGGLVEREKLKDTMKRFVNEVIVERATRGDIKLGGEKKECAIFFSDLRGFTAMSEKMEPEEVVFFLNGYFTGMVKCVTDTGGIVDKYIGDAIMAHWGALEMSGPLKAGDNDTENAVTGALMMREFLMRFNEEGRGQRPFAKFGCGINTGPVISGQIGSEERYEYTVIGDAVNLASRIETLNKPFGTDILISQDSYELVKHVFNVQRMPSITVKGKAEPQTIYAVLGRKDDPDCPRDMNEVRARTGGDPPKVDLDKYQEEKEEKFEVLPG